MDRIVNMLGAFAVSVSDKQQAAVCSTDLQPAEAAALFAVIAKDRVSISDVAIRTGLCHSGAVRVVDRLNDKGLVNRGTGSDRRKVLLTLTPAGRRRVDRAMKDREQVLEQEIAALAPTYRVQLARLLEKLLPHAPNDLDSALYMCRFCDHRVCDEIGCPVAELVEHV